MGEIVLYQPDETIRLDVMVEGETVWLTQAQMVELFQRDVSVISRHISNIFKEGELEKESNLQKMQIAEMELLRKIIVKIVASPKTLKCNHVAFNGHANTVVANPYAIRDVSSLMLSSSEQHPQKLPY